MVIGDATGRLAHQTRQLCDLIEEKEALWDDEGGRTTLHAYLRPHAEAAKDLVAALHERDELLEAFEAEMAIVERELEVAAAAHRATEAAVARATEDVRWADDRVAEILKEEAEVAELEATAVRYADLANGYPGDREFEAARERRRATLNQLQRTYPSLGVHHILEGEVNPYGKFTGCHSHRSVMGMVLTREAPDKEGVYYASVAGWSPAETVIPKTVPVHSMFPDAWGDDQICREVVDAYWEAMGAREPPDHWQGVSYSGMAIMGHERDDGSIVGYPVRKVT